MTRSRDIADQQKNLGGAVAPFVAGKNKIINGDFGIWQRGTSLTPTAGTFTYTSDRWATVMPAGTTVSRQTFTPGTAPVAGYEGTYYFNQTITANAQNYETVQRIEDARTFAGQTVTLSFWARSTVGAQPLNAALYQNFGTGGSPSSLVQVGVTTYTPTSSWQRFTFTYSVPSVAGKTFGTNNDSYLWVRIAQYTTTATNTSVDIWGVQLEAGSVATPFQTASGSIGGELALCQRYYINADGRVGFSGNVTSGSLYVYFAQYPVTQRITNGTITLTSLAVSNLPIGAVSGGGATGFQVNATANGTGAGYTISTYTVSSEL